MKIAAASVASLLVCLTIFVSGLLIGFDQAPEQAPARIVEVEAEQSNEEWLAEREQMDLLISSAQRMAANVERDRIQVCLLPEQYPGFRAPWCDQPYYRDLSRAVGR